MPTPTTKEVLDNSPIELLFDIVKYIGLGLLSLLSTFSLYMLGKYGKQHDTMWCRHQEESSPASRMLEQKEAEEFKEVKYMLKNLQTDVNGLKLDIFNLKVQIKALRDED